MAHRSEHLQSAPKAVLVAATVQGARGAHRRAASEQQSFPAAQAEVSAITVAVAVAARLARMAQARMVEGAALMVALEAAALQAARQPMAQTPAAKLAAMAARLRTAPPAVAAVPQTRPGSAAPTDRAAAVAVAERPPMAGSAGMGSNGTRRTGQAAEVAARVLAVPQPGQAAREATTAVAGPAQGGLTELERLGPTA
jgi:hypothetical protein